MTNCRYCTDDDESDFACFTCSKNMIFQTEATEIYGLTKDDLIGVFSVSFPNPHKKSMTCHKYNQDDLYAVLTNLIDALPIGKRRKTLQFKKNKIDGVYDNLFNGDKTIEEIEEILNANPGKDERKIFLCKFLLIHCETLAKYQFAMSTKIFNNFVVNGDVKNASIVDNTKKKLIKEINNYVYISQKIFSLKDLRIIGDIGKYFSDYVSGKAGYIFITKRFDEIVDKYKILDKEQQEEKAMLKNREEMMLTSLSKQFDSKTYKVAISSQKFKNLLLSNKDDITKQFDEFCRSVQLDAELKKRKMDNDMFVRCQNHFDQEYRGFTYGLIPLDKTINKIERILQIARLYDKCNMSSANKNYQLYELEREFIMSNMSIDEFRPLLVNATVYKQNYETFKTKNPPGSGDLPYTFKNDVSKKLFDFYKDNKQTKLIISDVKCDYLFFVKEKCSTLKLTCFAKNGLCTITKSDIYQKFNDNNNGNNYDSDSEDERLIKKLK